ncbi:hypothetical protein LZ30DRAFT_210825 [Colletotrichum cereale]|nr:hypothetical protein LZ30DRAFT_210825 [Colletotrichum cereale]
MDLPKVPTYLGMYVMCVQTSLSIRTYWPALRTYLTLQSCLFYFFFFFFFAFPCASLRMPPFVSLSPRCRPTQTPRCSPQFSFHLDYYHHHHHHHTISFLSIAPFFLLFIPLPPSIRNTSELTSGRQTCHLSPLRPPSLPLSSSGFLPIHACMHACMYVSLRLLLPSRIQSSPPLTLDISLAN